ncbi:MAG TPA: flagellar basal body rod protein FlgB [Verrucomicrobiae bacterium]|nr:flagellar basal body rod protein FlgB [Verrucomicrobiae bacterium]
MINALFETPNYLAAKKLLDATVLRHEAISSNLANLETPNYKRIDLAPTFNTELKQAISSRDANTIRSVHPQLQVDSTAVAQNKDGNTVQLENELVQMNQNTVEHAMETQLISGNLLKLRLAITGH